MYGPNHLEKRFKPLGIGRLQGCVLFEQRYVSFVTHVSRFTLSKFKSQTL